MYMVRLRSDSGVKWAECSLITLHWRHNDHDGVSNHQPHGCLLNRLFRRRSKKTSKLRVTGLCVGNSPGPVNSPHRGPVTRKMFPFDDVIIIITYRRIPYQVPTRSHPHTRDTFLCGCSGRSHGPHILEKRPLIQWIIWICGNLCK